MMKSSSPRPSSSSSSSSTSVTASPQTQLLSSSSSPPPLHRLNLQSPELQAEFLQEFRNKFHSHNDVGEPGVASSAASPFSSSSPFSPSSSSPLPSPFSPTPSSSPCSSSSSSSSSSSPSYNRQARLSLSSPELLSELKDSRTRSLRHVPARNGLTTVFSGRGGRGRASDPTPSTRSANQKTPL